MKDKVTVTSQLVTQQFEGALFDSVNRLKNLKRRLEITDGTYFRYWNKDAAFIIEQDPSFHFVEWIDSTGVIQIVEPMQENKEAIGLDITKLDYRRSDWTRTKTDSTYNLTHWLELVQGDYAFLVDEPVFIDSQFHGTISAGIDLTQRFDDIMQGLEEYHVQIKDDKGTVFYTFGDSLGTGSLSYLKAHQKIRTGDTNHSVWTISMVPNHLFQERNSVNGNNFILLLELILCGLVSVSFFYMQKSLAAEKSHKEANTKLRSLIDSSPLAICIVDTQGIVKDFWNQAAEEMFGWKRKEVIGNFIPFIEEENLEEFQQLMQQCIQKGELRGQEVVRTRKDGSEGIFLLNVGTIKGDEMLVLIEDITEIKRYEQQLEQSLDEKEILLIEIHHRVKNNLAIIAGLIELQKDRIDQEEMQLLLNETKNRIFSIAGVHELLYEAENFSEISISDYVERLVTRLQKTYDNKEQQVQITTKLNSFSVNINQAIPIGLLLNELITNSYKHAFKYVENPEITLRLEDSNNLVKIDFKDNGEGMSPSDFESMNSLGLNLIRSLLKQIEAEYEIQNNGGFGISFSFQVGEKGSHSNI